MTTAALRLQEAQAEDMGHLKHLSAVKEQRKRFSDITNSFCSRLEDHLLKVFQEHVRSTGGEGRCFGACKEHWG